MRRVRALSLLLLLGLLPTWVDAASNAPGPGPYPLVAADSHLPAPGYRTPSSRVVMTSDSVVSAPTFRGHFIPSPATPTPTATPTATPTPYPHIAGNGLEGSNYDTQAQITWNADWSTATAQAAFAPLARTITAGTMLSGGGDLSANRTLNFAPGGASSQVVLGNATLGTLSTLIYALLFGDTPLAFNSSTGHFSIQVATTGQNGYLSFTDWNMFNGKVSTTRAINTTAPITGGGDLSADRTIAMPVSTNSVDGYLSAADHTTFAAKESALTFVDPLIRTVNSIKITTASAIGHGALSAADWTTFNAKQAAGNYITALISDVTAAGPGSATATLVNIPSAVPAAGTIIHANISAPSSPASGKDSVYSDSTDLRLHDKNASGVIGTTVVADTGASHNFLTAISSAGAISKAQPAFTDISGVATALQGGTGNSGSSIGDILQGAASNTYAPLAAVATGNVLLSQGTGTPSIWGKASLTSTISGVLPVANGGTNTSTAFTSGSVVVATSGGTYGQFNGGLFFGNAQRLGIGTATPDDQIQAVTNWVISQYHMDDYKVSAPRSIMLLRTGRGSSTTPADLVTGDNVGEYMIAGYAGGAFRNVASMTAIVNASGAVSSTNLPTELYFETTPESSVSRAECFRLLKNGNAKIEKGVIFNRRSQTAASDTSTATDLYIGENRSGAITQTLVAANAVASGYQLVIQDESGAGATNNITITRAGSDTINGATTLVINTNYGAKTLTSDGSSKWFAR